MTTLTAKDEKHSNLNAAIENLGLSYSAVFVPQSKSRNAGEKNPSLNWKVTISKGNASLENDYMQGIGHAPEDGLYQRNPILRNKLIMESEIRLMCEKGEYTKEGYYPKFKIPAPLLRDVLYCLVIDSEVLNYDSFESWAEIFGYDTDSRKAEKLYAACMKIALNLKTIIGNDGLVKMQVAFQDY